MKVKLNLGCGQKLPLPFDDNSVDEIFSGDNFICYFSSAEWNALKKEIARVLKTGGRLEVVFLDFEYPLRAFLKSTDTKKRDLLIKRIFGGQANKYDYCKNGFTYKKMVADLLKEGMMNFKKKPGKEKGYVHLICYKELLGDYKIPHSMKVLIGTPIHEIKDYAMERWLENVARLQKAYQADLLLVDNSPGLNYLEKVKGYCEKYGIKNYKIAHIEVHQANGTDERIGRSRETIRQHILSGDYDAWFSWECDQIIPTNALDKLITIMNQGNFMLVAHGSPGRVVKNENIAAFGITLIKREALEKYGFLLEYPNMPNCWHGGENWFKKQILQGGGNYIEVYGLISPIYHLDG